MSITNTDKTSWTKPIMRDPMNKHNRYQTDILILHFSDHYGIRGHSLAWIEAWLMNWTQQVFLMGQSWARFAFYCTLTTTLAPEVRSQTTYDEIHHNLNSETTASYTASSTVLRTFLHSNVTRADSCHGLKQDKCNSTFPSVISSGFISH